VIPEDVVQRRHLLHTVEMLTELAIILHFEGSLKLFIRQTNDDHLIRLEGVNKYPIGGWEQAQYRLWDISPL
jgi:hypothetical protein